MRLKPCSSQENSVSLPASCGWDLFSCLGLLASPPLSSLPRSLSWPVPRQKEARDCWWLIITGKENNESVVRLVPADLPTASTISDRVQLSFPTVRLWNGILFTALLALSSVSPWYCGWSVSRDISRGFQSSLSVCGAWQEQCWDQWSRTSLPPHPGTIWSSGTGEHHSRSPCVQYIV